MGTPDVDRRPLRWAGCTLAAWRRLLARQDHAYDPAMRPRVRRTTLSCAAVSVLNALQEFAFGREVRRTEIREAPLFVLGHWRSGTTYLHDLLALDERHVYPTNLDCFAPGHFLLTGDLIRRWKGTDATRTRLMDDVKIGPDTPQEDEFALCTMGLPSPYLDAAFPNRPLLYQDYLDLENVPPRDREAWKRGLLTFMKRLTYRRPGRLVMKSPTHTARIQVLREMFPNAYFVHIVRNPYVVFVSTRKMMPALYRELSLQPPPYPRLDEYIFETYPKMMDRLERDRSLVAPGRFCQVRYEDVAADPVNQVRAIYDHLGLGGFDRMRPRLEGYLAELGPYRPNRHELPTDLRDQITERWGRFIRRYGYPVE